MTEFRFNTYRLQLGLPELPTTDNVASLVRYAEAELKDMVAPWPGHQEPGAGDQS